MRREGERPFGGPGRLGPHFNFEKVEIKDPWGTLRKLFKYMKKFKWGFIFVFILTFISSILGIVGPYLIGKGIDTYIIPKRFDGFLSFLLVLGGIYLLLSFLGWIQGYVMLKTTQNLVYEMRKDFFWQNS